MGNFTDNQVQQVWEKAKVINAKTKDEWRQDYAGAWINRNQYGKDGAYGWEVDHKKPVAKGGGDELSNLEPLQWNNNRTKGDDYPSFKTSISSKENKNIEKEQSWKYN